MAYAAASEARPSTSGSPVKFLIVGGVMALAVAYLVVQGVQSSAVYFLTVGELQAKGAAARNGTVYRVSGTLVPGTLVRDDALAIHFQIADPGATSPAQALPVTYRGGQVPDIVGDNVEIVAEGKLDAQGTFVASTVLAKCPSRLENAPPEEHDYGA